MQWLNNLDQRFEKGSKGKTPRQSHSQHDSGFEDISATSTASSDKLLPKKIELSDPPRELTRSNSKVDQSTVSMASRNKRAPFGQESWDIKTTKNEFKELDASKKAPSAHGETNNQGIDGRGLKSKKQNHESMTFADSGRNATNITSQIERYQRKDHSGYTSNDQADVPIRSFDVALPNSSSSGKFSPMGMVSPSNPRKGSVRDRVASLITRQDCSDFEVPIPLPSWDDDVGDPQAQPFDPLTMNCHGLFHVRVIRARRLPCPVGSSVYAAMSLPPWSGRLRTERVQAFSVSLDHGVCVRWDNQLSDTAGLCSMINAWSSHESPVPAIKIDLMFSPLGMGVFDFSMCTLLLGCEVLMKSPETWKTLWCRATTSELQQKGSDKEYRVDEPLILVEAMFAPSQKSKDSSTIVMTSDENSIADEVQSCGNDSALVHQAVEPSPSTHVQDIATDDNTETSTIKSASGGAITVSTQVPSVLSPDHTPHHLRVLSFFVPGVCSVCSRIVVGRNGFHCETCDICCCSDCRLNVDLQLPCGSDSARVAVAQSIQRKLTVGNIMSIVAPLDPASSSKVVAGERERNPGESIVPPSPRRLIDDFDELEPGIGCLKMEVVRACLFEQSLSADSEVIADSGGRKLRRGDYYARVTCSGNSETARTRTLQSIGMPQFDSGEMRFSVAHYGQEFRLELVDASTDITVGTALLTTHGILQEQRDHFVGQSESLLMQFLKGPISFEGKRKVLLELRTGVKKGFSTDFFVSSAGDICGWVEVLVGLKENVKHLYSNEPFECPPRPPDNLNVSAFQIHIARIKLLIEDVMLMVDRYLYIVSWKDPIVTGVSLFTFLWLCLRFNSEYSGSLPLLALIAWMTHLASNRSNGEPKKRFVQREIEACRKAGKVSLDYTLHRPVGFIEVGVFRGKNLVSLEFGLPGSTGCRVYWDPIRFADDKTKELLMKVDDSAKSQHEIGCTEAHYSVDPEWTECHESSELKRLSQLLSSDCGFFENSSKLDDKSRLQFPLLQPFKVIRSTSENSKVAADAVLRPWNSCPGAIVVEVRFLDILNNLPGFNDILGEVAIPVSELVENGEITGWFEVLEVGTTRVVPGKGDAPDTKVPGTREQSNFVEPDQQIYLALTWRPPSKKDPSPDEREASFAVQEELIRSSVLAQGSRADLVESSIGAINTALGISASVQEIQNTLGTCLDAIEAVRNAFNFTDPYKSSVIFALLVSVSVILLLVPTRYIILLAGLVQYGVTFVGRFDHMFPKDKGEGSNESDKPASRIEQEAEPDAFSTWITNGIRGLPTQEDLRKAYFWESRRKGARESEKHATEKRDSRLRTLWKAQWHAFIKLRMNSKTPDNKMPQWGTVFSIVQGHRFLWWRTVHDFDNGELPSGRIFLSGHAGLTGPSPLEMRELQADEVPLIVTIFGRGISGQERVMLLAPDVQVKESLEAAIIGASSEKAD